MNTIASRMAMATMPPEGIRHAVAASGFVAQAPNRGTMIVLVVTIVLVMALSSAARSLAGLLTELLRVATAMTSSLFAVVVVTLLTVVFLIHH